MLRTHRPILLVSALVLGAALTATCAVSVPPLPSGDHVHLVVFVADAATKAPLELVRVSLRRERLLVAGKVTDAAGRVQFEDVVPGRYLVTAHRVGYVDQLDSVRTDATHEVDSLWLVEAGQDTVVVRAEREAQISTIDIASGNQVFESEAYHAPPAARMTDLVQQNVMGAARAPTGEVHIRGQHGEFMYYVDGIPIPLGVFGGLNEVVDPKVIDRATFMTGGFPAEYGGQMAAVIDVQNRVPSGRFHVDASMFGGSYLVPTPAGAPLGSRMGPFAALNSNGQALSLSDHVGDVGIFLSGSRQETDRRIDPPVPQLFHDHGFDYFLYGKFDYLAGEHDYLTMNLNYGKTVAQIPFDKLEGGVQDDNQATSNAFQTLSYTHTFAGDQDHQRHLFIGGFAREGGLVFTPGAVDVPAFSFGDSVLYTLAEDRSFTTLGTRVKYDARLSHEFAYAVGLNASSTSGKENFTSHDAAGAPGPQILTNFSGSDFGVFAQSEWHPAEWMRFDAGLRYDRHIAPDIPMTAQLSPRIRWTFLIDEFSDAYLYAGSLFMPNNIEGLRTLAVRVISGGTGTLPERDLLYEAVYSRRFAFGLTTKFAAFYKHATPGVDDETIGSSAVKTPINIATVNTTGIECGLSYTDPSTPLSGTLNAALTHAYGVGTISGGFLDFDTDGNGTDLDHDQRLSVVATLNYQPQDWFASLTAIYGSGLSNGNPDAAFGTGLFDFNQAAHTTPSWILNLAMGYTIHLAGGMVVEPSLFVGNLLDHDHLIKGAYFSGASWEERRNVVFKIAVHI